VGQGFIAAPSGARLNIVSGAYAESLLLGNKVVRLIHGGGAGTPLITGG
jgi:hypothetical protein